jgi:hypothetical protein
MQLEYRTLKFIYFCFAFVIVAIIEVGIKNTKFVACAMCCSIPINIERHNIKIVPPPIPSPANKTRYDAC